MTISDMISKTKIPGSSTLKSFILSVIIVFIFHPLSLKSESVCSLTEETRECNKCGCCCVNNESDSEKIAVCEKENISCSCKLNSAEPAEERQNPVNLFTNIQKIFSGIKSGLPVKTFDSDIKENPNLITIRKDIPVIRYGIYLEISSLRI